MDRLPAVALVLALVVGLAGCAAGPAPGDAAPASGMARVNAVQATAPAAAPESWCEASFRFGEGPALVLPALAAADARSAPPGQPEGWIWLNLWASWCAPCVAEMDLLSRWKERLGRDRLSVEFWYLSLDEDPAASARFLEAHPGVPDGLRLRVARIEALPAWFQGLGLAADTAIPVQVLVAPGGRVRCVRVGAVNEADYGLVRGLLAGH